MPGYADVDVFRDYQFRYWHWALFGGYAVTHISLASVGYVGAVIASAGAATDAVYDKTLSWVEQNAALAQLYDLLYRRYTFLTLQSKVFASSPKVVTLA